MMLLTATGKSSCSLLPACCDLKILVVLLFSADDNANLSAVVWVEYFE